MLELAKAEGFDFSDEELEAINGDVDWSCQPFCVGKNCSLGSTRSDNKVGLILEAEMAECRQATKTANEHIEKSMLFELGIDTLSAAKATLHRVAEHASSK